MPSFRWMGRLPRSYPVILAMMHNGGKRYRFGFIGL